MRFIIREQPFERVLAAGKLQYEQAGRPTGAVERWRLTTAASGYRFLRVDLDAREAASGHTYLYHLLMNENGRAERLQYRFWGSGLQIKGNVLLEEKSVTVSRETNGQHFEEEVELPAAYGFWFPSAVGLGLLADLASAGQPETAVTLHATIDPQTAAEVLALQQTAVSLVPGNEEQLTVMGQPVAVRSVTIRWDEQERTLWLDEHNWPLKMRRDDGLTAVETRYIRYRPFSQENLSDKSGKK